MDISTQMMLYVCAVAKHLNFHKAAQACHTSQPNLSVQIKKVEKALDTLIFERSNKFVTITKNGQSIVRSFREILRKLDQLKLEANSGCNVSLKLGIFPTLAPYILPDILNTIRIKYPQLELIITEDKTQRICSQLETGELDCILAARPITDHQFAHTPLFDDHFLIAISKENPLSNRSTLCISDLDTEKILLLEDGHCLRDQSLDVCQNNLLQIDLSYQFTSLETLKAMVANNSGITFVPQTCIDSNPNINYVPISGTVYARHIALFWRKSSSNNQVIQTFCHALNALGNIPS